MKAFPLFIIYLFIMSLSQAKTAGLKDSDVDKIFKFQENPVWCWAATIEMCLNHYGFNISQKEIVRRTFGRVIPTTGNWLQMTNNLNYLGKDKNGKAVLVSASVFIGSPSAEVIINHLKQNKPIVIAFVNRLTFSGHAVLVTDVDYEFRQNKAVITSFTIRDPFPYNPQHVKNRGKVKLPNGAITPTHVWLVNATQE